MKQLWIADDTPRITSFVEDLTTRAGLTVPLVGIWLGLFGFVSGILHLCTHSLLVSELSFPLVALASAVGALKCRVELTDGLVALTRGLTLVSLIYIALQQPVIPLINDGLYASQFILDVQWALVLVIAVLSWRQPVWLILVGFYLPWIKSMAEHLSGFHYESLLDIRTLHQLDVGVGLIVLLFAVLNSAPAVGWLKKTGQIHGKASLTSASPGLMNALLFVLISFHMAGYLFSGVEKALLDGGLLSWPLANTLQNIYFTGVINQQLIWQDIPGAVEAFTLLMDGTGRLMSLMVFAGQLLAFSVFLSRRYMILMLIFYDIMHLGIMISQGANFMTWVLVNLCVIAAARVMPDRMFGVKPMIVSCLLMVFCQFGYSKFYKTANLAWYDTLAVNNTYFVAETAAGEEARLPIAFFGFYSYPISHMSYGHPPGGKYVPTNTNGGSDYFDIARKAENCSFSEEEMVSTRAADWNGAAVTRFIKSLHGINASRYAKGLPWSANLHWHHFWNPPSVFANFSNIDFNTITAYTLVVEATCIERSGNRPVGRILDETRFRIPIAQ